MTELTWIVDPTTGELTVEGLSVEEASRLLGDLLPRPRRLDCARPLLTVPLPSPSDVADATIPKLRVLRLYHASVVEGPGRRSVLQMVGCPIRCQHCFVPESHDPMGGVLLDVDRVVSALLDPVGAPRDGISILGGEPFYQPVGLLALLRELKARGLHTVVYTGYTLEALALRPEPEVAHILDLTDVLIDGPFIASLTGDAGEWRGSRNQRLIPNPGLSLPRLRLDDWRKRSPIRPKAVADTLRAASASDSSGSPDPRPLRLVFVGERRSRKAIRIGACWENGRLAAKTLHDALRAAGLDPETQTYLNLFSDDDPSPSEAVLQTLRELVGRGVTVIGMGRVVQQVLARAEIPHVPLIHPAARGRVRARALYHAHVARVLGSLRSPIDQPSQDHLP